MPINTVIVNSSPIIYLSKVGYLHLLKDLYLEITIPQAVYNEIIIRNDIASKSLKESLNWINVKQIKNIALKNKYPKKLHAGEVEVLVLAEETSKPNLVIIDDLDARKHASKLKSLGVDLSGTMGILLEAKSHGFISQVKPIVLNLKGVNSYLSLPLINDTIIAAGETP